jgi:hypothetical protein
MSEISKTPCLLLIEGLEARCCRCQKSLCLRQQVLNLALGADTGLLCLGCLASDNGKDRAQLLSELKPYVVSRECFAKEWSKYKSEEDCPDREGCLPKNCFSFT